MLTLAMKFLMAVDPRVGWKFLIGLLAAGVLVQWVSAGITLARIFGQLN